MRDGAHIPDLNFPSLKYSKRATPLDLTAFLFLGGTKANVRTFRDLVAAAKLGTPLLERLELVKAIHEVIIGKLVVGRSPQTAKTVVDSFRHFFTWAEQAEHPITREAIQTTYLHWTDSLVHRQRVTGEISQGPAYRRGAVVGMVLDELLGRLTPLVRLTRLTSPPRRKTARGVRAEKQNLEKTFAFGSLLQDVCDGLPINVVLKGPLPVRIPLRNGGEIVDWSGYRNPGALERWRTANPDTSAKQHCTNSSVQKFTAWETEGTLETRYPLANLRCEAELLMLIGQTGMNLAQAHQLKLRHFFYVSHIDGFHVKDRKNRRGGEVLFEIFKDYKPHFERYLDWRRQLFPDSDLLFPFVRILGRAEHEAPSFHRLRSDCKKLGVSYVSPQALRNTRINWLLRRSGDPELTAAMAQHTKETLLNVYERPSQQRAMGEVMRFWSKHDPALAQTSSTAPGHCNGQPVPVRDLPKNATTPDCIRPSGCLWCEHHRDIDSEDYVWSLACFRHLKVIEVSKWHPAEGNPEIHPGEHAIDRLSEKLRWFCESNVRRRAWMDEALARVDEGNYHPHWRRLIEGIEGFV